MLTGRIVDSYTNILTVKLFARAREEDAYVREALEQHTGRFHRSLRLNTLFGFCLVDAQRHDGHRHRPASRCCCGRTGASRSARSRWRCRSPGRSSASAGWVAYQITAIFENIGVVQEGMMTIARPIGLTDAPGAGALAVTRGEIAFEDVRFGYGRAPWSTRTACAPFAVIDG